MNKIFLLCTGLLANVLLFAQSGGNSSISVFFETGKSELSGPARQSLDALALELHLAADYWVNIEAFTDDRGTNQYNQRLAADRAAAVQQYLQGKGLVTEKTTVKSWGERKALGTSDEARQMSRRVDLLVKTARFESYGALRQRLSERTEQVMRINNSQEHTLTAAKGTMVLVPANAFVFEDGSAPKGAVDLTIQEAYDPFDFIAHNLTTTSGGRILQTGGMVRIEASADGKPLRLAEGSSLTVALPNGGNFDPQMELFYARATAAGVDWQPAGQRFRNTLRPKRAELNIDPSWAKRLAEIKVPEYPKPPFPVFKGTMPPTPKAPIAPLRPRPPKKPEWDQMQRMYAGGGQAARMSKKELKKAQKYYQEQLENYKRDSVKYIQLSERYQRNLEGYEKAKAKHAQEVAAWESELQQRLQAVILYQRELRRHCYSLALKKAIEAKAKTIQQYETYSNLFWAVDDAANLITESMMLNNGFANEVTYRKNQVSASRPKENDPFQSVIGRQIIDHYPGYGKATEWAKATLPFDSTHAVQGRIMAQTGLKAISDSLQNELRLITMQSATSGAQRDAAINAYVANVSQLGWINCDRFYDDPAEKMQVLVSEPEEATLYAVCKDIKAMLPFRPDHEGKYYVADGLPKGKQITVVAIKIKEGMPYLAQYETKVGKNTPLELDYKAVPLQALKEELRKISI